MSVWWIHITTLPCHFTIGTHTRDEWFLIDAIRDETTIIYETRREKSNEFIHLSPGAIQLNYCIVASLDNISLSSIRCCCHSVEIESMYLHLHHCNCLHHHSCRRNAVDWYSDHSVVAPEYDRSLNRCQEIRELHDHHHRSQRFGCYRSYCPIVQRWYLYECQPISCHHLLSQRPFRDCLSERRQGENEFQFLFENFAITFNGYHRSIYSLPQSLAHFESSVVLDHSYRRRRNLFWGWHWPHSLQRTMMMKKKENEIKIFTNRLGLGLGLTFTDEHQETAYKEKTEWIDCHYLAFVRFIAAVENFY